MTVPSIKITDEGIVAPSSQEVISGLWDLFKTAFGSDLNTSMATPQGQLVTSLAAMITDERNQMIELMNQVDPRYSQGIWQDAIGYIYFMTRKQAAQSTAELTLTGLVGTVVPAGYVFNDNNGKEWQTKVEAMINSTGQALVDVSCTEYGPVNAALNTITIIPRAINGLDRVTNAESALPGREAETRTDFELRRKYSTALNSKNTTAAVFGTVSGLKNVVDVYVDANYTANTKQVGATNYSMEAHSLLVSVVGGDDQEIAKAILAKGGSGCSFVGNTTVIVRDTENFSSNPPSYEVKFLRPAPVTTFFKVTLEDASLMSLPDEESIKAAILKDFTAGNTKARIGANVIASRFICSLAKSVEHLSILSIQVSRDGTNYFDHIAFGVDEFPVSAAFQIEVV